MTRMHIDEMTDRPHDSIYLTIIAPEDGGISVFESINGEDPKPKFSGNLSEAVKYLETRMSRILRQPSKQIESQVRSFSEIKREANSGRSFDLTENG